MRGKLKSQARHGQYGEDSLNTQTYKCKLIRDINEKIFGYLHYYLK